MICGDCDNNFVFINALQYTIIYMHIIIFLFLGYKLKRNKKRNKNNKTKKKQTKKQLLILKKTWFFAPLNTVHCVFNLKKN